MANLIAALVNRMRKVLFSEKTKVQAEDLELEHLTLYHNLAGSSPDNQRHFKDVRADVLAAVRSRSALQLGIALKLSPLFWEDKLKQIFLEVNDLDRAGALVALLPAGDGTPWPNLNDPLGHSDWRVRANAAMALAVLQAHEGLERMILSLNDTASSASSAFPHLANALTKLGGEEAKQALLPHLHSTEDWFVVDAVAALINWPLIEVGKALTETVLSMHPLTDYMCVSIARKIEPLTFLTSDNGLEQEGGCQIVAGLLEASKQTFTSDLLHETKVASCYPQIFKLVREKPTPLSMYALLKCAQTLNDESLYSPQPEFPSEVAALQTLAEEKNIAVLRNCISAAITELPSSLIELNRLRCAVRLLGALGLDETESLLRFLPLDIGFKEDVIESLGSIGNNAAAPPLVKLANTIISLKERTELPKSQQPIAEDNPKQAKLYWRILQALGYLNTEMSIDFLLTACQDYAPDKRQQAMESLNLLHKSLSPAQKSNYLTTVAQALDDSSAPVRVAALAAVAALHDQSHLDQILRLAGSQEVSISRQSFRTLKQLHQQGDKTVAPAIQAKISSESDQFRRKRLTDLLDNLDH